MITSDFATLLPTANTVPARRYDAVEKLAKLDPRQGHVVDLRFFAGFTVEETAAVLGVSAETIKLDWRFAKAWLQRELGRTAQP